MSPHHVDAVTIGPGPDHPYPDLPALPPAHSVESTEILKAVIDSSRALAALDQAGRRLPDPSMLINIIPILEAQASSEIENIVTTSDELFRAANGSPDEQPGPAAKEALRNQPGTFIGNPITKQQIHTPPESRDTILDHLSAWERFLHAEHGLDPLVAMAMQHYQFEAIHPFFDGNGRTGRVLNLLYLDQTGLLQWPVLHLSGHILSGHIARTKDEYYAALRGVSANQDWTRWILYLVGTTARWTLDLIEDIEKLHATTQEAASTALPSQAPVGWRSPQALDKVSVKVKEAVTVVTELCTMERITTP